MSTSGVQSLLADPRFEILPFMGFDETVSHLPTGAKVAVTASPEKGIDLTIDQSVALAEAGYDVIPHLAARSIAGESELDAITSRLLDAGIDDVFVPGGDNKEPAGAFESALDLLVAMEDLGRTFDEIGITGYPEGHPIIDDETLAVALSEKAPYATYQVTQLCFDPTIIVEWIDDVRGGGIDLPLYIGIPGVLRYQRLMQISTRVGVGDSVRFLRKTTGIVDFVRQLLGSRGHYTPDTIVEGLAPYADDPTYAIEGLHLYTFNQVEDLEAWRSRRLS